MGLVSGFLDSCGNIRIRFKVGDTSHHTTMDLGLPNFQRTAYLSLGYLNAGTFQNRVDFHSIHIIRSVPDGVKISRSFVVF